MIWRYTALRVVFILFSFFIIYQAAAQPTLPDITGTFEEGVVALTWNCQYDGVKAISVMRSADSVNNYEIIGYVKKTGKGIQVFIDGHPAAGKNFYKLVIAFNSGLVWRSNYYGIHVTRSERESSKKLPSNDSLQNLIVTESPSKTTVPGNKIEIEKESDNIRHGNKPAFEDSVNSKRQNDTCKTTAQKPRISISFERDTSGHPGNVLPDNVAQPARPRLKITLKTDAPDIEEPIFIRSRFINTDTATGYIDMFLPDDVNSHHYSVKFYDRQNHMVIEVPRINTSKIIFDKRNFQRKGIYKFILRKDYTELESGYIIVNPEP